MRLSGGHRQRLALARVSSSDRALLLLDETTSALDIQTERRILERLKPLLADSTMLLVAHRLSTVLLARRILVLADGKIIASGPTRSFSAAARTTLGSARSSSRPRTPRGSTAQISRSPSLDDVLGRPKRIGNDRQGRRNAANRR